MSIICMFYGIKISIIWNDHVPPHFHAEFNGDKVLIDILRGTVMQGCLLSRQLKLVLAWTEVHKDALMQDWELEWYKMQLNKIDPLV